MGLYSRVLLPDLAQRPVAAGLAEPTELALPLLAIEILPAVFVGFTLAGLFAATVSTADSQIIVCSGALTQDVRPRWHRSYLASKLATFSVLSVALAIALYAPEGVFTLVLVAWSALGASLGVPLIVRAFGWELPTWLGLSMMIGGMGVVVAWQALGLDDDVFKLLPGMLASLLLYALARAGSRWIAKRNAG